MLAQPESGILNLETKKGLQSEALIAVELEGIEPSSKQRYPELSTRLFRPSVFVRHQDPDHQMTPYPLKSHHQGEAPGDQLRFHCATESGCFGAGSPGVTSRLSTWCRD